MKDVIVLLSGGVDSAVAAALASDQDRLAGVLFIDYGQPALEEERQASRLMAGRFGWRAYERRLDLDHAMGERPRAPGPRIVHGRNLALLALAGNLARSVGAAEIWLGATADDAERYPDCGGEFISLADRALRSGCGIGVAAPLLGKRKAEILKLGSYLGVAYGDCWSCYTPRPGLFRLSGPSPCGSCDGCDALRRAVQEAWPDAPAPRRPIWF